MAKDRVVGSRLNSAALYLLGAILCVFALGSSVLAQVPNIGNNSLYTCVEVAKEDGCFGSIHRVTPRGLRQTPLARARLQIRRRLSNVRLQMLHHRTLRLEQRLANLRQARRDLRSCATHFNPSCDGSTPTHPSLACSVIGDSRLEPVSTDDDVTARIVNGLVCARGDSPVVPLRENGQIICSAAAIASDVVVTAAHCLVDSHCSAFSVRDGLGTVAFPSSSNSCVVHPLYTGKGSSPERYDVALVFLDRPLSARIAPLHLVSDFEAGETVVLAGFGRSESGSMRELRASHNALLGVSTHGLATRYTIGDSTGTTCNGDSGGPLLVRRGGEWRIAGVTSWGSATNCALPGYGEPSDTAVWTRLSSPAHREFLVHHLPELES